jgi:hypothetical protein
MLIRLYKLRTLHQHIIIIIDKEIITSATPPPQIRNGLQKQIGVYVSKREREREREWIERAKPDSGRLRGCDS